MNDDILFNQPNIFISHSHHDLEVAQDIKDHLEPFGAAVFIAHEDLKPSREWQGEIIANVKSCDAFIALLTDSFQASKWTDQETGMALALGKIIIPIRIDLNPYGFIGKFQALKWDLEEVGPSSQKLIRLLLEREILTIDNVIQRFAKSSGFRNAESNLDLLLQEAKRFSRSQIHRIMRASIENDQIWDANGAKPILTKLFSEYSGQIPPDLMTRWKRLIKEGRQAIEES